MRPTEGFFDEDERINPTPHGGIEVLDAEAGSAGAGSDLGSHSMGARVGGEKY